MFQDFHATTHPDQGPPRLKALRAEMASAGLQGFLVPRADAHQGEYVAERDARLAWLTGFTGSAGFCAVLPGIAGVFIDGRYRVQVRAEVAAEFTPVPWPETKLAGWLTERMKPGQRIGFDPWLHTMSEISELRAALERADIALIPTENLVDRIWEDRPYHPNAPFFAHPDALAGESAASKRIRLAEALREAEHRAAVLTLPDSIAWLLNIRGADIPRNPVPHAFAILHDDGRCDLFCGPGQTAALVLDEGVTAHPRHTLLDALTTLDSPVRLDPKSAPQQLALTLREAGVEIAGGDDPCRLPKARKTEAELAGMREAHLRDGAVMVRFLTWLDETAPQGGLTEIDVVTALEGFRRETNVLRDIAFDTICGAGPHGAIVHYRVTTETNRAISPGDLVLVDSGSQFEDGTTDITRTVIVGEPTAEHRACYTRVLQGLIGLSRIRFPKGLTGAHLDTLARAPLWAAGQDYDHGTGHGVGAYLCVHEGPQGFHRRSTVPLEPGMILSNEPGYYREGAFGIRIENLVAVQEAPVLPGGDDREMLDFETLTWVPFDRRLIDTGLLRSDERDWIDRYHADTLARISPRLEGAALDWLNAACAPL